MRAGLVRRFLLFGTRHRASLKINAPEVRCRRQKLHAHSGSLATGLSQVNNPAFLFFLRFRIHQNQHFAIIDFVAVGSAGRRGHSPPAFRKLPETYVPGGCVPGPATASCERRVGCDVVNFERVLPCAHHHLAPKPGQLPFRTGVATPASPCAATNAPKLVPRPVGS